MSKPEISIVIPGLVPGNHSPASLEPAVRSTAATHAAIAGQLPARSQISRHPRAGGDPRHGAFSPYVDPDHQLSMKFPRLPTWASAVVSMTRLRHDAGMTSPRPNELKP